MELLIGSALAAQDLDAPVHGRLVDGYLLEQGGQFPVLFDVLGVPVHGRRADDLQLVLGQEFLQVRKDAVQQGLAVLHPVEVLDDQHRLGAADQGFRHFLETVFDFAFVAHALAQGDEVQFEQFRLLQAGRPLPVDACPEQRLDQAGLADAPVTDDKDVGAVFPGHHVDHGTDFVHQADDRRVRKGIQHRDAVFGGLRGDFPARSGCLRGNGRGSGAGRNRGQHLLHPERHRPQLLGRKAHAGADQGGQDRFRHQSVDAAAFAEVRRFLDDGLRLAG